MRSPRHVVVTALAVGLVTLVLAAPSGAMSSTPISGVLTPTSANFDPKPLPNGSVLIAVSGTHTWAGSFIGTSTLKGALLELPTGQITYELTGTFTGTTPCGAGTGYVITSGSGPSPGPLTGRAVLVGERNGSVHILATLTTVAFLGPQGASVTYTGDAHCR